MKDYKKIIADKIKVAKVDSYDELINKLKHYNIKPQEAFNLVYKNKYQYNARYFWTMTRIGMYKTQRFSDLFSTRLKLFPSVKKSNESIKEQRETKAYNKDMLSRLNLLQELKKLEKISVNKQREDYVKLKKKISQIEKYWSKSVLVAKLKKSKQELRTSEKHMPKKIDSCRKVVASEEFQEEFRSFYPNNKFDARKEVQNLHKLVTEKRHRNKFFKKERNLIINKPTKISTFLIGEGIKRIL